MVLTGSQVTEVAITPTLNLRFHHRLGIDAANLSENKHLLLWGLEVLLLPWTVTARDVVTGVVDVTEAGIAITMTTKIMIDTIEARVMTDTTVTAIDDTTILAAPTPLAITTRNPGEPQLGISETGMLVATMEMETLVVKHAVALSTAQLRAKTPTYPPTLKTINLSPLGPITILLVTTEKMMVPHPIAPLFAPPPKMSVAPKR